MRAYLGIFRMRLIRGLSYRAAALAGVATQFFWGFILIMTYQAFARSGASPLNPSEIASYVWLQQAFLALVAVWFRDNELLGTISAGDTAYELCRPLDLYRYWFARLAAGRLAAVLLRCLPILALAFFLPEPYRLHLPPSPIAFLAFLGAIALGLSLMVAVSLFAYTLSVASLNPQASFIFITPIVELASGVLIPLPFLPDVAQRVLNCMPFRYCADFPFRLYSGSIPLSQSPRLFFLEFTWLLILVPLGRLALKSAVRGQTAVGG
jgi:ABC-2 type transport system permease protein